MCPTNWSLDSPDPSSPGCGLMAREQTRLLAQGAQDLPGDDGLWRVYTVVHTPSGRTYVGCTCNLYRRWINHWSYRHLDRPLSVAMRDNPIEQFSIRVLSTHPTRREAIDEEGRQIVSLDTLAPNGFNIRNGLLCASKTRVVRWKTQRKQWLCNYGVPGETIVEGWAEVSR